MATDKRIDAYIAKSQEFAKPILEYMRTQVHKACPRVEEDIKWGMPYFSYNGKILCAMAAFKQHCSFSFSRPDLMKDPGKFFRMEKGGGMGVFGKIQSLKDVPPSKTFTAYIKEAMQFNEDGFKAPPMFNKAPVIVPDYFQKALDKNKAAKSIFEKFAPSHRKEYIKWMEEAKTEATRNRRMETALEWIAEGKNRNWKHN